MNDKELLLKDTFSRLGTNTKYQIKDEENLEPLIIGGHIRFNDDYFFNFIISDNQRLDFKEIGEFKPYLFPLSSMTPEQRTSYNFLSNSGHRSSTGLIDFFNKNHLDYRGLIPKGLAIDSTGLNIY